MEPVREITDRYRIGEVLASNPSLTVCTATDASSGARVVVEVVVESRGATAGAAARFLEAVTALARLRHSSLPAVLDGGVTDDGAVFLVREWVDGRAFDTLGGESPGQILSLLLQVVGGLELLCGEGFHHGSLSLDTLWVAAGPERPRAKVLGLATGVWRSRQPDADAASARAEDLRALGVVACRLLGAKVSDPASAEPRVKLPLAVAFELEDADTLRLLLERCLRADAAARPAGYSQVRTQICAALWGDSEAGMPPATGTSGAPPARLTFTTVPEDSLVEAQPAAEAPAPAASRRPQRDEGEITKVVLPEELEGFEAGAAEDTAEPRDPERRAGAAEAERGTKSPSARPRTPGAPPREKPRREPPAPTRRDPPPPAVAASSAPPAAPPAAPPTPPAAGVPEPDEILSPVSFLPTGEETLSEASPPGGTGAGAPGSASRRPPAPPDAKVPAAAPAAAAAPRAPRAAAPARAAKASSGRKVLIAVIAAGVLMAVVAAVALVLWLGRGGDEPVAERPVPALPAPVETTPEPAAEVTAREPADPRLLAALERFSVGEEAEARTALAAIPADDQASFSASDCALLDLLDESVSRAAEERAAESIGSGLENGDLARLRRGAAAVAGRESAFLGRYPGSASDLDRARRVLAVLDRAREAAAGGNPMQVLEQVAVLSQIFPAWEGAQGLRESAATSIEGEADALFEQGRYDAALERLDALAAAWPGREGLERRRQMMRTRLAAERDLGRLLQAAERAAADGRPDEGLELISGISPPARMADRFAETRRDLEQRLAEIDGHPPTVQIAGGVDVDYAKDEAAKITFRVSDDFRVERVTVHARVPGDSWQVVPHSRSGGDAQAGEYQIEFAPDFHRNEPVELYITATDASGHTGNVGSAESPIEVKRRRWFHRLIN